jgi:hypothetical protein
MAAREQRSRAVLCCRSTDRCPSLAVGDRAQCLCATVSSSNKNVDTRTMGPHHSIGISPVINKINS